MPSKVNAQAGGLPRGSSTQSPVFNAFAKGLELLATMVNGCGAERQAVQSLKEVVA